MANCGFGDVRWAFQKISDGDFNLFGVLRLVQKVATSHTTHFEQMSAECGLTPMAFDDAKRNDAIAPAAESPPMKAVRPSEVAMRLHQCRAFVALADVKLRSPLRTG